MFEKHDFVFIAYFFTQSVNLVTDLVIIKQREILERVYGIIEMGRAARVIVREQLTPSKLR